jgi:hypothetical protein
MVWWRHVLIIIVRPMSFTVDYPERTLHYYSLSLLPFGPQESILIFQVPLMYSPPYLVLDLYTLKRYPRCRRTIWKVRERGTKRRLRMFSPLPHMFIRLFLGPSILCKPIDLLTDHVQGVPEATNCDKLHRAGREIGGRLNKHIKTRTTFIIPRGQSLVTPAELLLIDKLFALGLHVYDCVVVRKFEVWGNLDGWRCRACPL